MAYEPYWNSLKDHVTPKWLKEAKFGIYTHWGIYSVPARGPNGTWYPYNMYREGTEQYNYHVKTYGHPSKFGYKDFIPMFKGEKFDPDEWAELFKRAGAKFAGPVAEHHDGFTMWDSRLTEWNAVRMGPKRDVVGELEQSIRKQGLKFMIALHHAENWFYFPHWEKEYDTSDPRYAALYGPPHGGSRPEDNDWNFQEKPSKEFLDMWLGKGKEVLDKCRPDMVWFDFGLKYIQDRYKREFLAYYYNKAQDWGRDVVVTYKYFDIPPCTGVVDIELGRFNELTYHDWITDTTVDDGEGWCYLHNARYKPASSLIHYLAENVSKNGYMLLNVGPKPDGEIPEEAKALLLEIGKWLAVNGEAIYGTTPWTVYGEGPTKMVKAGAFSEQKEVKYTAKDIRYTVKNDSLYAICLGWPEEEVIITKAAKQVYESEIGSVKMLGAEDELQWAITEKGLEIKPPATRPCEHAYVFKIERKSSF